MSATRIESVNQGHAEVSHDDVVSGLPLSQPVPFYLGAVVDDYVTEGIAPNESSASIASTASIVTADVKCGTVPLVVKDAASSAIVGTADAECETEPLPIIEQASSPVLVKVEIKTSPSEPKCVEVACQTTPVESNVIKEDIFSLNILGKWRVRLTPAEPPSPQEPSSIVDNCIWTRSRTSSSKLPPSATDDILKVLTDVSLGDDNDNNEAQRAERMSRSPD